MSMQEVVSYNPIKAALNDLAQRYKKVVFDVSTQQGMAVAKAAYKDINQYSVALENARVKEKADSLAYGRFVDAEAKRIAEQLDALRLPIKEQIDEVAKREQREREAAIKAEQDRILAEQAAAKAAEEKRMAEQRAEIARQQAEIAKAQREAEEHARAARAVIETEQRAARAKIEAEERAARQAREEADRAARIVREQEEAKLKAERDRIEAEARAVAAAKRAEQERVDAEARKVREAEEAKQREIFRKEAEKAGAREMLELFVKKYGHLSDFVNIADKIREYLRQVS